MKVNWGKVLPIGMRVAGAIFPAVRAVELFSQQFPGSTGAQKKQAVLDVVQQELASAELVAGRDLANDADVLAAAGAISDAVVAFQNLLARKVAAAGV